MGVVQLTVFYATFFNTGLAMLLLHADLSQAGLSNFSFSDGTYPDYTEAWYNDVSVYILTPMFFEMFMSFVETFVQVLKYSFVILLDRYRKPAKKTVQAEIEMRTGPEFEVNERYASTMAFVSVCFMYGTGLPILYWYGLLFLVFQYFCDKFLLVLIYRKPPMLDDELHKRTLRVLNYTILIYAMNSYWMLSNKQLFGPEVHPKSRMSDTEITGHTIF